MQAIREARLRGALIVGALCALHLGCGSDESRHCGVRSTSRAIVGGNVDPGSVTLTPEHRTGIVRVLPSSETELDLCTGVFVARDWVLTARHCEPTARVVELGPATSAPLARLAVDGASPHPDVDLLLLHVPDLLPSVDLELLSLRSMPLDDSWLGRRVELAGFGSTETGAVGQLRFVTEVITSIDDASVVVDGMEKSGACLGDSGGPLLGAGADASIEVLGILSTGAASCRGKDRYLRIDAILPWLTAVTRSSGDACSGS